jgi:hypothetical protein
MRHSFGGPATVLSMALFKSGDIVSDSFLRLSQARADAQHAAGATTRTLSIGNKLTLKQHKAGYCGGIVLTKYIYTKTVLLHILLQYQQSAIRLLCLHGADAGGEIHL